MLIRMLCNICNNILTQHFNRYGEVVKSQIIKFRETGFGKGFGFVTFADSSVVHQVLQDQQIILGRTVEVNLATPKGESRQSQRCSECQQFQRQNIETSRCSHTRKIFVGGLPHLFEQDFKKYFESFGKIEGAKIIFDRATNTPRGFGFVTYESEEAVTNVLQNRFYMLNNKLVEVKKAEPREYRVMDSCNYYDSYPTYSGYGMWPIYDSSWIYASHSWANHTMGQTIPFNHLGTNVPDPQPVPVMVPVAVPYFTSKYPVNCYGSMHNQVDERRSSYEVSSNSAHNSCSDHWGSHNSVSHEENDQDCNNIEVQLVGNDSPRAPESAKPLEKEADNGETDQSDKNSQVNTKAENSEKDQSVGKSQVNSLADNGEKEQSMENSQVNTENDTSEESNGVSSASTLFCQLTLF
ncbi:hypothetical protein RND71_034244 [Anisodus tanguticus]|uniref:RRM domain-containing protein n=1 Tax=Anisodus tanguticus TaxID=243964 RepID=A0AAE1V4T4_9SOLA|nr:hypothetical protein RND71_034244 [Anisodus tanguticus]